MIVRSAVHSFRRLLTPGGSPDDRPHRVLTGPDVVTGRLYLAHVAAILRASALAAGAEHNSIELWATGVSVNMEAVGDGEVRVEFWSGLVLMAQATRARHHVHLHPLRSDFRGLELVFVPAGR